MPFSVPRMQILHGAMMDIRWIEDYVALRETRNFTAAAERRNMSQPAFSRRIQSLEEWLGVSLVDRSQRPLAFTPLAVENDAEIRNLLHSFHDLRSRMRGEQKNASRVKLAIQHSLAISFLPQIFRDAQISSSHQTYFVYGEDRARCIELMYRGEVDITIVYETEKFPSGLPETIAARRNLGIDSMVLVGLPTQDTEPQKVLSSGLLPLLTYPHSSFFGQVLWDQILPSIVPEFRIETICVSTFSSALKEMVQTGLGYAWLPRSLVANEIAEGKMVVYDLENFTCPLNVALYTRVAPQDTRTSAWSESFSKAASSIHFLHI